MTHPSDPRLGQTGPESPEEDPGVSTGDEGFSVGDRVVLTDTHHMHNKGLKACEGGKGTVQTEPSGHNDKYLVEFDRDTRKLSDSYWVAPTWLEPVSEGEDRQ